MLSDDVYQTRLRTTVTALEQWLTGLRAVASIETARDAASWRVAITPHVVEGCPLELVLRTDRQFDFSVGPETYEDQAVDTLDTFQPLLEAIAAGKVKTCRWSTAATGNLVRVATRVAPDGGARWQRSRAIGLFGWTNAANLIRSDRHYAPYARGA